MCFYLAGRADPVPERHLLDLPEPGAARPAGGGLRGRQRAHLRQAHAQYPPHRQLRPH